MARGSSGLLFAITMVAAMVATYNAVTTLVGHGDGGGGVGSGGSGRRQAREFDTWSVEGRSRRRRRGGAAVGEGGGGGGGLGEGGVAGSASASGAVVARPDSSGSEGGGGSARARAKRRFHTAMTCNESPYTAWQSRIMFFYYQMYRDGEGSEMGGFTRVLHSGRPDRLMDEIPTFVVDPLPVGEDKGYVVLNRPWAFVQWIQRAHIEEEYVYMAEPDHIIVRPIPNLATEHNPAAFPFFYINPKEMEKPLRKYYPNEQGPITNIDPIGNSPVIIKKDALARVAPLWMNLSKAFKSDPDCDKAFGWVQEMYAYATAAALLGYTHILRKDFMIQPPWDTTVGSAYIIHYTYGCDYDSNGKFTPGKVGEWHFDKRNHQRPIPRNLSYPPHGAAPSVFELIRRFNDATWTLDWPDSSNR